MYFFPTPYFDEILYSVLARYSIQSCNVSSINNIDDIFGSRNIVASVELPGNLDIIVSNLPANSKYTSDYFIYNNTLFPYIASFLPAERAKEVRRIMKDGQASLIYNKSAFISGDLIQNRNFRFCPECLKEDVKILGEMYWHRLHQITGVFVCPVHRVPLYDSNVSMRGIQRQSFIQSKADVCMGGDTISYSDDTFKKLLWIAEDVQKIINRTFLFQSIENQKYLYMEKLIEKNFANLNSMVHQKKLRKSLLEFWGEEVLQMLQSPIHAEHDCSWLSSLVRENAIPSQPLRNLILMRFLGIDIKDLLEYQDNNKKSHKEMWEQKIKELVKKEISLREMAIKLKSTPNTVKKHIIKLGIEPFWKDNGGRRYTTAYKDTQEFNDRKKKARKDWIRLKKQNPNLSRNKIKKLDETLYTRLVRYDKKWLDTHSPKIRNYKSANWEQRDEELLFKVKKVVEEMRDGKPERILWTTIGGKLGICGWFLKNKEKIPMVKSYLELHIENLQDFHLRRINWAIEELESEGKSITKWRLLEKAGVKHRYIKDIHMEISEMLKIKGYDENLLK